MPEATTGLGMTIPSFEQLMKEGEYGRKIINQYTRYLALGLSIAYSFSYALLMGHNVWMHLTAVQEANRRFDAGEHPAMMQRSGGDYAKFEDIVEAIFAAPTREESESIIEHYDSYWMEIVGTRGFKGKKTKNARTQFNALFEYEQTEQEDFDAGLAGDGWVVHAEEFTHQVTKIEG